MRVALMKICSHCGMIEGNALVNEQLWDTYDRISDGRSRYEPLVFTGDWMNENVHDEEDHDAVMLAMERDMLNRGLCPECARPDLRGVTDDMILSDEDYESFQDMWAEEAAERRAGC